MEKLVCLLYLLLRDELPAGTLAKKLDEVSKVEGQPAYTNMHLENYARDIATRLFSIETLEQQQTRRQELKIAFPDMSENQIENAINYNHSIDYIEQVRHMY